MTTEEIKSMYSMRDIADRYGLHPNSKGFIHCPFHTGDKGASLKLYDRDYHCFACGAHGDIFRFIQDMDNVTFKEAFLSLGGTYDKPTFASNLAIYRAHKRAEMRRKERAKRESDRQRINYLIGAYRWGVQHNKPLSEAWCENYNKLQYQLYLQEEYKNEMG